MGEEMKKRNKNFLKMIIMQWRNENWIAPWPDVKFNTIDEDR